MFRLVLTPLAIIGIVLLPSCSNEQEKTCQSAEISRQNYDLKAGSLQKEAAQLRNGQGTLNTPARAWTLEIEAKETYKLSLRVILNNQECFTNEQVAEAQKYLEDPANK